MKKDIMEKWVAALRSGEYKQTDSCLKKGDSFCCLGVLTDLYLKETRQEWDYCEQQKKEGFRPDDLGSFQTEVLPYVVQQWSGVRDEMGASHATDFVLTELNDNGSSFGEIADIIEENWEEL